MSNASSSYIRTSYASPIPTPPSLSSKLSSLRNMPKPANVFTNDGSFLERVQRSKEKEDERRKEQEALERKKNFDSRFRNRGKRPPPDPTPSSVDASKDHPTKRAKPDEHITEFGKQLKTFESRTGMKDTGTGIRPLVK